jgi:uncharacterized protein YraI
MMWFRRKVPIAVVVSVAVALAGCNFSTSEPEPTPPPTRPVVVVPTIAPSPTQPPTFTPLPTHTPTDTPIPSATPTETPYTPSTSTLAPPTPTTVSGAYVCPDCGNLRLRQSPGTAGTINTYLDANTPLNIIGRTADNGWIQVVLTDGSTGWVAAQYVDISIDLNGIEVTGTAEDAPPVVVADTGSTGSETDNAEAPGSSSDGGNTGNTGTGYVASNVISGITSHSRQIYLNGQSRGNRATVFEKVGDSITFSWAYMFDLNTDYNLGNYSYLQPALGFFSGPNGRGQNPFSVNPPIAAYPGWTTGDVLKPGNAKAGSCGGGESPLECAYRTGQPSVALIMLGTNDAAGDTPVATYQANMQKIIDISINMGVIPVLSTIPPFPIKDANVNAYNQAIRTLARANDVPLVDFWAAINNLPNRGLSLDGVHPSESPDRKDAYFDAEHLKYGFNVLNLGRLQVLYELWRQVLYDGGTVPDEPPPPPAEPTDPPVIVDTGWVDPSTYSCPGTLPIRLTVGGQGRVTPGAPNKMRSGPSLDSPHIASIPGGAAFDVTGGPHCADGYTWWKVNYSGQEGWTASGSASEYWVEPG